MSSISKLVAVMAVVAPQFESADALKLKLTSASPYVHAHDLTREISFATGDLPPLPDDNLSELDSIRDMSESEQDADSVSDPLAGIDTLLPGQELNGKVLKELPEDFLTRGDSLSAISFAFPAPPKDSLEARLDRHRASQNALKRTALLKDRKAERVVRPLPVTLERLQNGLVSGLKAGKPLLEDIIADTEGLRPLFREFLVKEDATADFDFLVSLNEHWDTDDFQNGSSADEKLEEAMALINIVQGTGDMFDVDATPGASWWGSDVSKPLQKIASGKVDKSTLDANTFAKAKEVSLRTLSEDNLGRFIKPKALSEALSKQDDSSSAVRVDTPATNQPRKWSLNISMPTTEAFLSMFRRASAPEPKKEKPSTSTDDTLARRGRRFSMPIFGMGRASTSTPATAGNDVAKPHSAVMVETTVKVPSNTASPISSGASTPTAPGAPAELADLSARLEEEDHPESVSQQVQVASPSVSGGGLELDEISSTSTALDGEHSERSELSLSEAGAAPVRRAIAFNRRHANSNINEAIAEHERRSSELVEMTMTTEQATTPRHAITGDI